MLIFNDSNDTDLIIKCDQPTSGEGKVGGSTVIGFFLVFAEISQIPREA